MAWITANVEVEPATGATKIDGVPFTVKRTGDADFDVLDANGKRVGAFFAARNTERPSRLIAWANSESSFLIGQPWLDVFFVPNAKNRFEVRDASDELVEENDNIEDARLTAKARSHDESRRLVIADGNGMVLHRFENGAEVAEFEDED